tara:strand:+ start:87 stop:494 length:408 start_codon:yes stop_codon:yes gene_type:complete
MNYWLPKPKLLKGILFFSLLLITNAFTKEYVTYDCSGHSSICDDRFVMKFTLEVDNNDNIFISKHNLLEHKHIVKVNGFNNFKINSKFYVKFYIINNLNHKFLFTISGKYNDNNLSLINLEIELDSKKLAKMKLK